MCGIFGVIRGKESTNLTTGKYAGFVADALLCGTLRGINGTGVATLSTGGLLRVDKLPIPGPDYMRTKQGVAAISRTKEASVVIGHHRSSTRGVDCVENTHPFLHKKGDKALVGVHNGVIRNAPYTDDGLQFDVDSDWALYRMLVDGVDAFSKFDGPFSFVYYASEDKTVNFVSNEERPLHWAYVEGENSICYASERHMLEWLMYRNHIVRGSQHKKNKEETYTVTKEEGLKFNRDDLRTFSTFKVPKYSPPKSSHVYTPTAPHTRNYGSMYGDDDLAWGAGWEGHKDGAANDDSTGSAATKASATLTLPGPSRPAGVEVGTGGGYCENDDRQLAIDLDMRDEWGTFIPDWYDKKSSVVHGTFILCGNKDGAVSARIKGVTKLDIKSWRRNLNKAKELFCEVMGMHIIQIKENGKQKMPILHAILDKPVTSN